MYTPPDITEIEIGQWRIKLYLHDDWMQSWMEINDTKLEPITTSVLKEIVAALKNEVRMKETQQIAAMKEMDQIIRAQFGRLVVDSQTFDSEIIPTPDLQNWRALSDAKLSLGDLLDYINEHLSAR